jgi:hypothetical protein
MTFARSLGPALVLGAALAAAAWAQATPTAEEPEAPIVSQSPGTTVSETPQPEVVQVPEVDYDALADAAANTYRPGPVFSTGAGDPILFRGPFILRKRPVPAEHKFPTDYGKPYRSVAKLRYYPFLAWDVYLDHGDCLMLLATNYLFNSAFPPKGTDCVNVDASDGLAYVEVPEADGTTSKYLVLRLRDKTLKVTRIDDGRGLAVFAVYAISGYSGARFAQEYVESEEPVEMTILASERAAPREGEHLRRLLEGWEDSQFHGYWTLPEKKHIGTWGGILMPRDLRVVDVNAEGSEKTVPIDIGAYGVIFEQALTYTGHGYAPSPGDGYNFPLFFPSLPKTRAGQANSASPETPPTP